MQINIVKFKLPYPFILFAALFFAVIFVIENINGRFWLNDFRVYYSAANAFLHGEKIYESVFGEDTGLYKYSPFVLLLFTPYCLFTYYTACVIHFIFSSVSAIACIIIVNHIIREYLFIKGNNRENILMSAALLFIATHLVRELHLGNINTTLLLLLSAGLFFDLKARYVLSGAVIALVMIFKPYFGILLVPLFAFRKWRTIWSLLVSFLAILVITIFSYGYSRTITLHQEWIASLQRHNATLESNQTIQSIIQYYGSVNTSGSTQIIIIALVSSILYLLLRSSLSHIKKNESALSRSVPIFVVGYFISLALIPDLVITDTQHFLLSLPVIMILLYYFSHNKNKFIIAAFLILIFFFGGNSSDLLGKTLSLKFDETGLLGIANLILVSSVAYLFLLRHETIKLFSSQQKKS